MTRGEMERLQSILDDETFLKVVNWTKMSLVDDWTETEAEDVQGREVIWAKIQGVDAVVETMRGYINAAAAKERRAAKKKRAESNGDQSGNS